jgi:hypothetical protein
VLTQEADGVAAEFAGLGLRERQRAQRGEWTALLLEGVAASPSLG